MNVVDSGITEVTFGDVELLASVTVAEEDADVMFGFWPQIEAALSIARYHCRARRVRILLGLPLPILVSVP